MDSENMCLICWGNIDPNSRFIECLHCEIILHEDCENTYRNESTTCICPHCTRSNCLLQNPGYVCNNLLPSVDTLLDNTQYNALKHNANNELIYSCIPEGIVVYRIEKNFKRSKRYWNIIASIVTHVNTTTKQIGTLHPDNYGRMYHGIIYYDANHKFNVVDYYIKIGSVC